jgi:glycerophosphoryl diester phosphodiesterase
MLVIAHRGASAQFAENTLDAFFGAVEQGADGVELDVRRTADGQLAISHDDTLPDGTVVVESALADLPAPVTDLAHALDACAPLPVVNIEIKNWPEDKDFDPTELLAGAVVDLLRDRGELDDGRALISSFHLATVDRVHELAPDLATGWLIGLVDDPLSLVERAADHGHVAVHPHHAFVNDDFVRAAHGAGLAVNTWTCDEPERIRSLESVGVDAVITNVPSLALRALGR